MSIRKQCELLSVPRGRVYYAPKGESIENLNIMRLMDEHYINHPTEGVIGMRDMLLTLSILANTKRVRRLLRQMGIMAIYPKRNLSKLGRAEYIRPYLLRNLDINKPNQVWAIDITYIPMAKGFLYLTAVIDLYSRYVVSWGLSNTLEAAASLDVLKNAIAQHGKPEIVNSDQGSQFTCALWIDYLTAHEIQISMDGKGRALDNIFIERLWRSVKYDCVYLRPAEDGLEQYAMLREYFLYYNHKRPHQGIEHKIPVTLYNKAA
jgi:putative transposase